MNRTHNRILKAFMCIVALSGCGTPDQGGATPSIAGARPAISGANAATATPTSAEVITHTPTHKAENTPTTHVDVAPPEPSMASDTTTPFPTIRANDIKLTPIGTLMPEPPTPKAEDPFNLKVAAYRTSEITSSTNIASLIIIGEVVEVGSARWTTPDQQRPSNPHAQAPLYSIFRPIRVQVQEVLKGEYTSEEILIYGVGGVVGQDSVTWYADDLHEFKESNQVVLFVGLYPKTPQVNGKTQWEVVDKFTVIDGQAVNLYHRIPLQELANTVTKLGGGQ